MPNRIIKFRFWNPPGKAFVEKYKYSGAVDELFDHDDMLIPSQFTGLQDINNIDVYENDIIAAPANPTPTMTQKKYKIVFKCGSFAAELINPNSTLNFIFMHQLGEFEILGNSLENPELL